MTHRSKAAVVSPVSARLGWSAAALASILLLLAAHATAAPAAVKDSDLIGKWTSDPKDPAAQYQVTAGAKVGELRLLTPKALKLEPIALHRTAHDTFSSTPGRGPDASIKVTDPRHGRLSLHKDDKTGVMLTYVLIEKQ